MRITEFITEAANPAQQAAIAVNMKKHHQKPKDVAEGSLGTYVLNVMDAVTGEHWAIEIQASSPDMAKERAQQQGYKVLRIKEKGVAEGSLDASRTPDTDQILQHLTSGFRTLERHKDWYNDFSVITKIYSYLRSSLMKGDYEDFSNCYEDVLAKYPDAASELIEAMFESAGLDDRATIEDFFAKISEQGVAEGSRDDDEYGPKAREEWLKQRAYEKEYNKKKPSTPVKPANKSKEKGVAEGENWSKHNNPRAGGMSKKSVSSYRRSHPGSKIQTAVTTKPSKLKKGSKAAKRRASFCARMRGMKKHRTGAKTAHDPNSNINKSLRRWHCESIEELQELVMIAEQFIRNKKNEL